MFGVEYLREQAKKYRQLATEVSDRPLRDALLKLAVTYETVADELAGLRPPSPG